jgi:hypothetical protein
MANFIEANATSKSLEYLLETPWADGDIIEFGGVTTGHYDGSRFDADYIRVRRKGDAEFRLLKLSNYIRTQTRKSKELYQEFLESKFGKELFANRGHVLEFLNSIKEGVYRISKKTVTSDFTGKPVNYAYFDFA